MEVFQSVEYILSVFKVLKLLFLDNFVHSYCCFFGRRVCPDLILPFWFEPLQVILIVLFHSLLLNWSPELSDTFSAELLWKICCFPSHFQLHIPNKAISTHSRITRSEVFLSLSQSCIWLPDWFYGHHHKHPSWMKNDSNFSYCSAWLSRTHSAALSSQDII